MLGKVLFHFAARKLVLETEETTDAISSGNAVDISASVISSDCTRVRRELFLDCEREMKKHCIQFSNLKLILDLDGNNFGF
jgi:hypothetical protein